MVDHYAFLIQRTKNQPAFIGDSKTPRSRPPSKSTDYSGWLLTQLHKNSQHEASQNIKWLTEQGSAALYIEAMRMWIAYNRTGAVWDFKKDVLKATEGQKRVTLAGHTVSYQAIANIHFGYVGRAAGIDGVILHAGAGAFQIADHFGDGQWDPAYGGDQRWDYLAVELGVNLHQNFGAGSLAVTRSGFEWFMNNFLNKHGENALIDPGQ
jgi:hypothetical protein